MPRWDVLKVLFCSGKWAIVFPVIEQETFGTAQDIMCQNVTASKAQRKIFPTSLSSISLLVFIYSVLFFSPPVQIWCLIFSSVVPLNNSATHLSCSRQMINWSVISYEVLWVLVWVKTVPFPSLFLLGQSSFRCIQLFPLLFSVPVVKTWWRSPWMCLCAACSQIAMSYGSRAKTAQCWITSNPQNSAAQNWRAGGSGA